MKFKLGNTDKKNFLLPFSNKHYSKYTNLFQKKLNIRRNTKGWQLLYKHALQYRSIHAALPKDFKIYS